MGLERGASTRGRAVRADTPPVVDGRDDDAVWRTAAPMHEFRQFAPAEDGDPSFRTEIRASYDDRNLYVVVRAFDPHPDSIVSLLSRRDVRTNSDQIKIIIDGYLDRRTGIEMAVNPSGVKRDASIYSDVTEDPTWDGVWDAAARIDSLGWVAEFSVPFSQIRFRPGSPVFGFGVWRDIARRNERVAWPLYRTSRQALASQLGTLEGIVDVPSSRRIELLPYTVAKNVTERRAASLGDAYHHPQQLTAGLDVKMGVTPNVTVDGTVNPDFGQVESDPAVLNLTAFEVRFEERRPFFQEGVGLFRCGGPCEGVFYTRRIGRAPQLRGSAADPTNTTILGAAKLTGRLGAGVSVGLVEAVTQRETDADGATIEPRTNYVVGRLLKEANDGRSQIGVMFTGVNRDLDPSTEPYLRRAAYTGLLQGIHRFARDQWELMMYTGINQVRGSAASIAETQLSSVHLYQRPDHEERFDPSRTSLGGGVVGMSLSKLGGFATWNTYLRRATAGLELNDLGFVPTVNDFSVSNTLGLQTSRPGSFYRRLVGSVSADQHWTLGGLAQGSNAFVSGSAELLNSWTARVDYSVRDLAGVHCVACARGGPAVRQSPKHEAALSLAGDPRGSWTPELAVSANVARDGRSRGYGVDGNVEVRVASRFSLSVGPTWERSRDDQQWIGNFGSPLSDTTHFTFAHLDQTTLALTTRVNWTASPTLSLQLYAQPFVSAGEFTGWKELDAPRAERYGKRYKPFRAGDSPGGFNFKQFNSNAVVRWEYRPGSALFVIWQQGRLQDDRNPGSFALERDWRDLFGAHPDNTLLVKLSYWLGR